jgi:protein involved in ribonucleotide reduction
MLIVYLSTTGNIRKFVKDAKIEKSIELSYFNPLTEVNEDYVLIIPSIDDEITDVISEFIDYKNNLTYLQAVVGSGNTTFGVDGYCYNAVQISLKYNKPLIHKFEHSGTDIDIRIFKEEVQKIEVARATKEG